MSKEFKANQNQKLDNQELNDWLDSLDAVVENHGREGAKLILEKLENIKYGSLDIETFEGEKFHFKGEVPGEKADLKKWADGEKVKAPPTPTGPLPKIPFHGASKKEIKRWKEEYKIWADDNSHLPTIKSA